MIDVYDAQYADFSELVGKISLFCQNYHNKCVVMHTIDKIYFLYHSQDCCESVYIDDICGELSDLCGTKIYRAEENSDMNSTEDGVLKWTFYKLDGEAGDVVIKWLGESNGYYSVAVDTMVYDMLPDEIDWLHFLSFNLDSSAFERLLPSQITGTR